MVKMTVGVKGMMCAMCESHVAGAVQDKFEVEKVKADKGKENCVVIAAREIPETELRAAIDATGYETTSYQSEPYEKKGFFSKLFG